MIRIDRLEKVYEALVDVTRFRFNIHSFECGTSACAIGWYIKKNPRCGLRLCDHPRGGPERFIRRTRQKESEPLPHSAKLLSRYFRISEAEATHLFMPLYHGVEAVRHNSYEHTLDRLRAFIDAHKSAAPALDFKREPRPVMTVTLKI